MTIPLILLLCTAPIHADGQIDTMIQQAFEDRIVDTDQALAKAMEAERIAIRQKDLTATYWAKAVQVILHAGLDQDTIAIRKFRELNDLPFSDEFPKIYAYLLLSAGKSYFNVGLEEKAREFYQQSIGIFTRLGVSDNLIRAYIDFGSQLAKRGLYNEGLEQFNLAHEIALNKNHTALLSDIYRYLANVNHRLNNVSEAKKYVRMNISRSLTSGQYEKIGDGYLTLANIFNQAEQPDSALHNYDLALHYYQLDSSDLGKSYVYANMAEWFADQDKPDSAKLYFKEAARYLPPSNAYKRLGLFIQIGSARVYSTEGQMNEAEKLLQQALVTAAEMKEYEMMTESLMLLTEIKDDQQQYDSALHYYKLYKSYNDTIRDNSTREQYANLRIQLNTVESDHKLGLLNNQLAISRTRTLAITVVLVLIVILSVVGFLYYRSKALGKQLALENSEIKNQSIQQELALRQKELADFTLNRIRKNKFLDELQALLRSSVDQNDVRRVSKAIELHRQSEKEWEDFYRYFGNVHKEFFEKLKLHCPQLTSSDLKHSALIKLNLSLKEAAQVLGVDPGSIKMARYRLKKKLNLGESDSLDQFLFSL